MRNNAPRVYAPTDPDILQSVVSVCTSAASLVLKILTLPLLALTSHGFKRVLLAVVVLNGSWQIQKHFFLRQDAADLGSLGGLQISLTTLALAGLYAAWLMEGVTHCGSSKSEKQQSNSIILPATIFLSFCTLSLFVAGDTALGVFEVVNILERFLLFFYVMRRVRSRNDLLFVTRVLLIGLIIQSILMLAQASGLVHTINWYGIKVSEDSTGDSRIFGTMGSPNPAAAYISMCMVFAFSVLLSGVRWFDKCLSGLALCLAVLPLFFTLSRGGTISFLVGFMTVLFANGLRVPRRFIVAGIVMPVFLCIFLTSPVQQRFFGDDRGSAASRMPLNKLALAMIEDHPLLGVGSNNFSVAMQPYLARALKGDDFVYTVHNTYLRVFAETGIGGVIAFLWFLLSILHRAFRVWLLKDYVLAPMSLGCAAATMGHMFQMNFEPFRGDSAGHLLWLFAGMVTVMHRLSSDSRRFPSDAKRWA